MSDTLHDLLMRVNENDVLAALTDIDEKNLHGYGSLIVRLRSIVPEKSDFTIVIRYIKDATESYYDVSGRVDGEETSYAIEFVPWSNWLGSPFRVDNCDLTETQIVAYCLDEMTWAGWNPEDIQEKWDDITGAIEEIESELEE